MFGSLRKKLKETVKKLSERASEKPDIEKLEEQSLKEREHINDDSISIEESPKPIATTSEIKREIENIEKEQKGIEEPFEEIIIDEEASEEEKESFKEPLVKESKLEPEERIEEELHIKKSKLGGLKERFVKKITVKTLSEKDIDDFFSEIEPELLQSNVALEVVDSLKQNMKSMLVSKELKRGQAENSIKESIKSSLFEIVNQGTLNIENNINEKKPQKIIFVGFNGSGKTTSIAKLANYLKNKGFSVVLAAGDTWRAAAQEQLEHHGEKIGVKVIKHQYGADSAAVIFDAIKHAEAKNIDVVLADTAGRTQANINLMDELKKVIRVNKPDLKILVVDSLTGNDAVEQAQKFNEVVGVDAVVLTKVDVDEKGGSILSVCYAIKKPILFLGIGQDYKDFEIFNPEKFVNSLLE